MIPAAVELRSNIFDEVFWTCKTITLIFMAMMTLIFISPHVEGKINPVLANVGVDSVHLRNDGRLCFILHGDKVRTAVAIEWHANAWVNDDIYPSFRAIEHEADETPFVAGIPKVPVVPYHFDTPSCVRFGILADGAKHLRVELHAGHKVPWRPWNVTMDPLRIDWFAP